jgi:hypothetical protein
VLGESAAVLPDRPATVTGPTNRSPGIRRLADCLELFEHAVDLTFKPAHDEAALLHIPACEARQLFRQDEGAILMTSF